ncbi:MAG: hypothetical protein NVS2B8_14390 [Vulcanimicrobiaceae bacterium]
MTAGAVLPATMRAAVMYDVDDIRIEERPLPALAAGDVLVRTGASGVCSGGLMPWYVRKKAPFVFGHEPAGTVVALGPPIDANASVHDIATPELALGDRVFAHHHAPCLSCETCRCGRFVQCATWRATALEPGGMSEYFRVPHANLVDTLRLPAAVSFVDASLVEPLGCVVKSLRRALAIAPARSLVPHDSDAVDLRGTTVYVIGAGVMGLMHVAVAAALGATVYASDYHASRRDVARALGAVDAFEPASAQAALVAATGTRLADTTICGPGDARRRFGRSRRSPRRCRNSRSNSRAIPPRSRSSIISRMRSPIFVRARWSSCSTTRIARTRAISLWRLR